VYFQHKNRPIIQIFLDEAKNIGIIDVMATKTRSFRIDINHAWCKGCEICAAFCPKNVFSMNGKKVVVIDPGACTGCLLCEMYCPDFAIKVTPANDDTRERH